MVTESLTEQGPFLSSALICEKLLEERDGIKSAIRIIDRITRSAIGSNPPPEMEPFDYSATLLIRLKSGRARGSSPLRIELIKPSGERPTALERIIYFEGEEDRGVDIVGNLTIKFEQTGIYWFKIYLANRFLTQVPLRVIYLPQPIQIQSPPGGSPPALGPPIGP